MNRLIHIYNMLYIDNLYTMIYIIYIRKSVHFGIVLYINIYKCITIYNTHVKLNIYRITS